MLIDIDKLPHDGLKISRDFDFPSSELIEEGVVFLRPARADVSVTKIGQDEVRIKGRITTCLSFVCGELPLTPFEFPVDSRFDLIFLPEELHEVHDELEEEDLDQLFFTDRRIDLREVVLEQLNLTFPAKPSAKLRRDVRGLRPDPPPRRVRLRGRGKEAVGRLDQLKIFLKDKR